MSQPTATPVPDGDDLRAFTYQETADRLRLSLVTVKRLAYSGRLRTIHVGRRALVPASAVREFLAQDSA